MSEEVEVEEVESPPNPCAFCGQTGENIVGWTEEGEDIIEPCNECGGDGFLN